MKLILSQNAADDLSAIAEYISAENPEAAFRIISEIEAAVQKLTLMPYLGASRDGLKKGYRLLVIGNYNALYRVEENSVCVDTILHHAQDMQDSLRE